MKEQDALRGKVIPRYTIAIIITGLLLFLPAGTLFYGQAWIYLGMLYVPMIFIIGYLLKRDIELLKRRLNTKEKKPGQRIIASCFYLSLGLIFVISGVDKRYHWSSVPLLLVVISDIFFLAGYLFLFLVFKENKYLAHTVVVEKKQEVVSTGPYALVRHPMYLSELIMFIATPLALGSYWALVADVLLIVILIARIITEEQVLFKELKGYYEYTKKTKYRLIPGVW